MSSFIKALATLLKDRQDFRLQAVKIKEDLVLTITPDFKGQGKITHITVPAEDLEDLELDAKIFGNLTTSATTEKAAFQATQTEAPERDDDDDEEEDKKDSKKESGKSSKKSDSKKVTAKTSTSKKTTSKKSQPAGKTKTKEESVPSTDETVSETTESVTEITENVPTKEIQPRELAEGEMLEEAELPGGSPEMKSEPISHEDLKGIDKNDIEESSAKDDLKKTFNELVAEGKKLFADRKWLEAQTKFRSAIELFPDDKAAAAELKKATQWVNATAHINKV